MGISKQDLVIQLKAQGITTTKQQLNSLHKSLNKSGKSAAGMAAQIAGATVALLAAQRAIASVIATGKEFEQSMANVKAISGASSREFAMLEASAKKLGATTVFTASQVAELQTEFAKLGFTATEITGVTKDTLALSAAVGSDLATSAMVAGATLRGFGLDVAETSRVTDVMAASFSSSALDMDRFANSMQYVAPIAKAAGVDIEGTTALLGQLANAGISGSMAGTSLRRILLDAGNASSKLAKRLGGPITSFEDFTNKLIKLRKSGFDPVAEGADVVGRLSVSAFEILLNGAESAAKLGTALNDAGGAAQQMAEIQLDTLEGKLLLAQSAMDGLKIELFEASEGPLKATVEGFTAFIESLDAETINSYAAGILSVAAALGVYKTATVAARIATIGLNAALAKTPWGAVAVAAGLLVGAVLDNAGAFETLKTEEEEQAEAALAAAEAMKEQAKQMANLRKEFDGMRIAEAEDELSMLTTQYSQLTGGIEHSTDALEKIEAAIRARITPSGFSRGPTGAEVVATEEHEAILENYGKEADALEIQIQLLKDYIAQRKSANDTANQGTEGGGLTGATDEQIEKAKQTLADFHFSEIESIELQQIAKLNLQEAEVLKAAEIAQAGEEEQTRIKEVFNTRRKKVQDKFDKMERDAQLKHTSMLLGGSAAFLKQFAGGEKIAARIQQTKAIIDTFAAANKAYANAGGFPLGVAPAAASIAYGMANVMTISKQIGEFKTAATGMDAVVSKPTMILAGEAGAEQVSVTPLEGPNIDGPQGGQSINITFQGNVMSNDFIENEAIPQIKEAVRRGADLGVS